MVDASALTWAIRRWTVPWHSGTVAGAEDDGSARAGGSAEGPPDCGIGAGRGSARRCQMIQRIRRSRRRGAPR